MVLYSSSGLQKIKICALHLLLLSLNGVMAQESLVGSPLCSSLEDRVRVIHTEQELLGEPPRPLVNGVNCPNAAGLADRDNSFGIWVPVVVPELSIELLSVELLIRRTSDNFRTFPAMASRDYHAVHPFDADCSTLVGGNSVGFTDPIEYNATRDDPSLVISGLGGLIVFGARYSAYYLEFEDATCADLEGFEFSFATEPRIVNNFCSEPLPIGEFQLDAFETSLGVSQHCEGDSVGFSRMAKWYRFEPGRDMDLILKSAEGTGIDHFGIQDYSFHRLDAIAETMPNTRGTTSDFCLTPTAVSEELEEDAPALTERYTLRQNGLYCIYALSTKTEQELEEAPLTMNITLITETADPTSLPKTSSSSHLPLHSIILFVAVCLGSWITLM